jgi:hypothetical protein
MVGILKETQSASFQCQRPAPFIMCYRRGAYASCREVADWLREMNDRRGLGVDDPRPKPGAHLDRRIVWFLGSLLCVEQNDGVS